MESILGAHPDKPFTDVMKATDFLIAKGWVDENGWRRRAVLTEGSS